MSLALRLIRCTCVVQLFAAPATAEPRVVFVDTPAAGLATLAAQMDVHRGREIEVTTIVDTSGLPVAPRVPLLLVEHDAVLVVWVEPEPTSAGVRAYALYVAGRAPSRALIERVRVEGTPPETEIARIVALKLAGLLDTTLAPRPAGLALGVPSRALRADGWRIAVGADVLAGGDRSPAAGPSLTVERRWTTRGFELGSALTVRTLLASSIEGMNATVAIDDGGAVLALEAGYSFGFARAGAGMTVLHATATGVEGDRGAATVLIPTTELGVGMRLRLSATELAVSAGIDHAMIRQRFLVDDLVISDLGRIRGFARLMVSLRVP